VPIDPAATGVGNKYFPGGKGLDFNKGQGDHGCNIRDLVFVSAHILVVNFTFYFLLFFVCWFSDI